jgi:RHS repeat-associated protein
MGTMGVRQRRERMMAVPAGVVLVLALLAPSAAEGGPAIRSVTPAQAFVGDVVTVVVRGAGGPNVRVSVHDAPATVLSVRHGPQLTSTVAFRVPRVPPGPTHVEVSNPGGVTARVPFLVLNHPPVARAGADQTALLGATVQLDGSASTDVDGDELTFRWSFVSKPAGSGATLSDPTAVGPTFVVDRRGTYVVQLVVNDGASDSAADTVRIDTRNSAPVARAGPDQTVAVGSTVVLDGTGSFDVDGDPLGFRWSFVSRPAGSQATLTDPTADRPAFIADLPGRYVVELIVSDGALDSQPDTVQIDTRNSRPQADAGPAQLVQVGSTVQLDGTGSSDADGDALTFHWSFTARPAGSAAILAGPSTPRPTFVTDLTGTYVVQLIVSDGAEDSLPVTVTITAQPVNLAPVVDAGPDRTVTLPTDTVSLAGSVTDDGLPAGSLTMLWSLVRGPGPVVFGTPSAATTTARFSVSGTYVLRLTATDGALASSDDVTVVVNPSPPVNRAPIVDPGPDRTVTLPATASLNGVVTDDGLPDPPGAVTTTWGVVSGPGPVAIANPAATSTTASFSQPGTYVLRLTAFDGALASTGDVTITVQPAPGAGLPPDPGTVAPPVRPGVGTAVGASTEFLYTGPSPIQTGVAPGTIDPARAAVVRGRVIDRSGAPLAGVTISILGRQEFGQTLSRADGMFDLAVNGGGLLVVRYRATGYLPAQRQVLVRPRDFTVVGDVALVPRDAQVTVVDLTSGAPVQVARGSQSADGDGTRRATLMIPQGTQAWVILPDGSTQAISTLSIRLTEYTVGPNGPKAMPAPLPANSGYTYAFEVSADEAVAKIGGRDVLLSQPVPFYVENFLGFPVGMAVPTGYYDADRAAWVPVPNGRVIRVLDTSGGVASVDTDGDGVADGGVAIGMTAAERQALASLYAAGQTLWRVALPHFSTWDSNWAFGPNCPGNCAPPPPPGPDPGHDDSCWEDGSIIACQPQVLGEAVALAGTPFRLHYASDRVPGRRTAYNLTIALSGATVPATLKRIDLEIAVAGQFISQTFPGGPNQSASFSWDGRDAYGRVVNGGQPATVRIGYVYDGVYQAPALLQASFGYNGNGLISGNRTRQEVTLWSQRTVTLGLLPALSSAALGGWTLSAHHAYDFGHRVLYLGDGRTRSAESLASTIDTAAVLTNVGGFNVLPYAIALAPDGSLYVLGHSANRIYRVDTNGTAVPVAGTGGPQCLPSSTDTCGEGGPALQARLSGPIGVAVGPDGSVYFTDGSGPWARVRRVDSGGILTTIAGGGAVVPADGAAVPATQARLESPWGITVGPDGSVYVADSGLSRIFRVDPAGMLTSVAGGGLTLGDGGPATQAQLADPKGVALGPDGSLYVSEAGGHRVRRIDASGIITTVAGTGTPCPSEPCGDGGLATQAQLLFPQGLAVGPDGSLYISDTRPALGGLERIRRVGPDGVIARVAGGGTGCVALPCGDGGPALLATFAVWLGVAAGQDGTLWIGDAQSLRIRRVRPPLPGFSLSSFLVAAESGQEIYEFSSAGQHLRTLDALTGSARRRFDYDASGRLASIVDADGNVTTIEREGTGAPTAIVAPFGQRTSLTLDANGYLASIVDPAGASHQMASTADGLLARLTDPRGNTHRFFYDSAGRLARDEHPAGLVTTLARVATTTGSTVTRTTALGRTTTYVVDNPGGGVGRQSTTFPDGTRTEVARGADATQTVAYADGTRVSIRLGPDPRWGMLAPVLQAHTIATPGGRSRTTTVERRALLANPGDPFSLTTLTETVTVNGQATTRTYDAATRTLTVVTPAGRRLAFTFDSRGRVIRASRGGVPPMDAAYDARGRLMSLTSGAGRGDARRYGFSYQAVGPTAGLLESATDPLARVVRFAYDAAGRLRRLITADSETFELTYDGNGALASVTPPGRPAHTFEFRSDRRIASYAPPGGGPVTYGYDADGRRTGVSRADGQSVTFAYDAAGRLTQLGLGRGQVVYTYDATTQQVATITAPDGVRVAYTYDGFLPTSESWSGPVAGVVATTYDDDFRARTVSVNGNAIAYAYDPDDLVTGAGALTVTRDAQSGRVTGRSLGGVTEARTYTDFGELRSVAITFNGSPLYSVVYGRDALGRIVRKTETIAGVTTDAAYGYDLAGRLTSVQENAVTVASYAYDGNGNRTGVTTPAGTTTATYDAQDRLTALGGNSYAYNGNGDLLTRTSAAGASAYQYDALGNLTVVTLPDGTRIDYLIDGRNRRVGKRVNGVLVGGWLYDGVQQIVAELDGTNNVVSRFVYDDGGLTPAYLVKGGVTYRIVADQVGSVRLVIDVGTGQVVQRLDYDAFGNVLADTNPGFQPFGFAGGLYDRDTRLVRFGTRDYDPEAGRWTTRDPILFAAGAGDLYAYAGSDPVNRSDPSGLDDVGDVAQQAAAAAAKAAGEAANEQKSKEEVTEAATEAAREVIVDAIVDALKDLVKCTLFGSCRPGPGPSPGPGPGPGPGTGAGPGGVCLCTGPDGKLLNFGLSTSCSCQKGASGGGSGGGGSGPYKPKITPKLEVSPSSVILGCEITAW